MEKSIVFITLDYRQALGAFVVVQRSIDVLPRLAHHQRLGLDELVAGKANEFVACVIRHLVELPPFPVAAAPARKNVAHLLRI